MTKPGGVVVAIGLSRYYPLFEQLAAGGPVRSAEENARFLADGQHRNRTGDIAGFTTSYFHRPDDLAAEVTAAGLCLDQIIGANGIVKLLLPDLSERLDDEEQSTPVIGLLRLLETEPSVLGVSQNLVAVARPGSGQTATASR